MLVKGISKVTRGLGREFQRLEAISANQANSTTPGFHQTLTGVRQGRLDKWRDDSPGAIELTNRAQDLAPTPGNYFQVQRNGATFLTKRGDLQMDTEGFLIIGSGERLLDSTEQPIRVNNIGLTEFTESGDVYVNKKMVATVGRVKVDKVIERGGTLYTPARDAKTSASTDPVMVGAIEGSNSEVARNQTDLMATIQRARVYAQAATLQDGTIQSALQDILGR